MAKTKRVALSLSTNVIDKLQQLSAEKGVTKSRVVSQLVTQGPQLRDIDNKKLNDCLQELQSINNQIARVGNNLNQYQHDLNFAINAGYLDKDSLIAIQQMSSWVLLPKMQKMINATVKELTASVNY